MTNNRTRADRVEAYTASRVERLQARYRANTSDAVATLARLRRGVGTSPGDDIELLGLAFQNPARDTENDESLYDDLTLVGDAVTPEERAVFAAITLFAVHQQSRRDASMHRRGYSLGRSARLLGRHNGARDAVRKRFTALGTAATWDETVQHARGLVQQFRQFKIPLDYGAFARDLYVLHGPGADRVRMAWGRDFYRIKHPDDDAPVDGTENTEAPSKGAAS